MQHFEITLTNRKRKNYFLLAWLFALIVYAFELYLAFNDAYKYAQRSWVVVVFGILLLFLITDTGFRLNNWSKREYIGAAYGFIAVPFIKWQFYWPVAILFLFMILLSIATRKFCIIISEKNIIFPSFPPKKIDWSVLNNLILKDDVLTIDFKNNRLIQQPIDDSKTSVNEKEFNDFCQRQLNK
jgi:hypothetical protein